MHASQIQGCVVEQRVEKKRKIAESVWVHNVVTVRTGKVAGQMMNNYSGPKSHKTSILGTWIGIQAKYAKNLNSYIFRSVYQIDMTFDRHAAAASNRDFVSGLVWWQTILRWRTTANLKIDLSPYLSEKSSDFYDVIKKRKSCIWTDSEFDRTYFLF